MCGLMKSCPFGTPASLPFSQRHAVCQSGATKHAACNQRLLAPAMCSLSPWETRADCDEYRDDG